MANHSGRTQEGFIKEVTRVRTKNRIKKCSTIRNFNKSIMACTNCPLLFESMHILNFNLKKEINYIYNNSSQPTIYSWEIQKRAIPYLDDENHVLRPCQEMTTRWR